MCVCIHYYTHKCYVLAVARSRVHIFMTFCMMLQLRIVKLQIITITNLIFVISIIVIIIIAVFTTLFTQEITATPIQLMPYCFLWIRSSRLE